MDNFNFRYKKILKIRKDEEQAAKVKLGEEITHLTHLRTIKNELQAELKKVSRLLDSSKNNGCHIKQLIDIEHYKSKVKSELSSCEIKIKNQLKKVKEARNQLLEATQEKKKIEKLREKDLTIHQDKMKKNEAIVIDEIVSFKEARKSGDENGES